MSSLAVGMVAGEVSGDLLAGAVLAGLRARDPGVVARGIGGPAMAAAGFEPWWTIDALSVRGYAEVLRAYPRLLRMRRSLRDRMLEWRPDLFVGVDAPDFNLGLERALRAQGIRTAHFISPSVWAWRRERLAQVRAAVDHMLLVFPFEQQIYDEAGIPATYVGHPLADLIPAQADREAARRALSIPQQGQVVALMPGSRPAEIHYMAADFVAAAAWLAQRRPDIRFVLPAAGAALYERLRAMIARHPPRAGTQLQLVQGRSHEVLAACDVALIASGTATLEAALFQRPMLIAYRMAWLSYRMMKDRGYLPWIGLPNILCRDTVVPELIQEAASPAAMGGALQALLESPARCAAIAERFGELHGQLRRGCAERSAAVLQDLARRSRVGH
jgi:lipid-A-disaccharide synthase